MHAVYSVLSWGTEGEATSQTRPAPSAPLAAEQPSAPPGACRTPGWRRLPLRCQHLGLGFAFPASSQHRPCQALLTVVPPPGCELPPRRSRTPGLPSSQATSPWDMKPVLARGSWPRQGPPGAPGGTAPACRKLPGRPRRNPRAWAGEELTVLG